jgi:putative FmdB family regulatory protein
MPLYEYQCKDCGASFDSLRSMKDSDSPIPCKECHSQETARKISTFNASSGGRVVAALPAPAVPINATKLVIFRPGLVPTLLLINLVPGTYSQSGSGCLLMFSVYCVLCSVVRKPKIPGKSAMAAMDPVPLNSSYVILLLPTNPTRKRSIYEKRFYCSDRLFPQ